jgi:asparagine synthase (glutamine-hydrolysing)
MCGFVVVAGDGACAPGMIERGLRAVLHRGPDGNGVWRDPAGRAALGHARHAILDLSNLGAQPMRSHDGGAVIATNGEIYNFMELAADLPVPLRSRSDTEVLLELLRASGTAALRRLRGMFAFAYWDGEELLLVRDWLGIKPVFFARTRHGIAAASEIGGLLAMGVVAPKPDLRAIDDYLTYLYVPPPRTGVVGIEQLPPGHLLRFRPGAGVTIERYWAPPIDAPARPPGAAEVRAVIEDAVRSHLVSDTPVGVFLSGGLDSSSIVALAARHYAGTLKTFTVTFGEEGRHLDERAFAAEVAERYGTDHTEIAVRADVTEILPAMVSHFGQPFGNPTAVLVYALSKEARRHVKVALAGDGGDEVLGGYPRYQGLWAAELYRRLPRPIQSALRAAVERAVPAMTEAGPRSRLRRFVGNMSVSPEEMYFRWLTYLDDAHKEQLLAGRRELLGDAFPARPYEYLFELRERYASRSLRDAATMIDVESFLPQNVLTYGDRMSMAHALEVRVPFCDRVLVEELLPMPLDRKMLFGVQKGLVRWAMRRDLPRRVISHGKVGFNPPIVPWLRLDLGPLLDAYVGHDVVRDRGLLRPEAVAELRRGFTESRLDVALTLWSLVVLEAWLQWLDRSAKASADE